MPYSVITDKASSRNMVTEIFQTTLKSQKYYFLMSACCNWTLVNTQTYTYHRHDFTKKAYRSVIYNNTQYNLKNLRCMLLPKKSLFHGPKYSVGMRIKFFVTLPLPLFSEVIYAKEYHQYQQWKYFPDYLVGHCP